MTEAQLGAYSTLLDSLLEYTFKNPSDEKRHPFMNFVRGIESGGYIDLNTGVPRFPYGQSSAESPISNASGVYQFTPATVETAIKRARNIGVTEEFISKLPKAPTQWSNVQADVMFLVNLFPRSIRSDESTHSGVRGYPGLVDELLESAFVDYDREAMEELYYTLHYLAGEKQFKGGVNPITKKRVRKMSVPENVIDLGIE